MIGIQYGHHRLCFLLFGFFLMMIMRWQIAHPGLPVPLVGPLLAALFGDVAAKGIVSPDLYNSFGAMHGTIMVFLAIVPLAFAAFGNYVVPLQIGAPDMAFPRVNMASYQAYVIGGLIMFTSFFIPGGPAQAGWTSYSPLATSIPTDGQTFWIIGMVFLITSSLLGAVNFIATIIQLRAPGMTWMRLPFFVWAQFVTAFLLLLAFPPLEAAAIMQLMDKVAHTSFFLPTGLAIGGNLAHVSGGGSPLLWQHLFWFLAHPEVYVLILPAMGIVAEVIANNTRKPIWGYKSLVYSVLDDRVPVLHRLGAPHVSDGHGHPHRHLLPDDHDDHLHTVGDRAHLHVHLAVGRVDSLQHADALRDGFFADVRHRRPHRFAARAQLCRHSPA